METSLYVGYVFHASRKTRYRDEWVIYRDTQVRQKKETLRQQKKPIGALTDSIHTPAAEGEYAQEEKCDWTTGGVCKNETDETLKSWATCKERPLGRDDYMRVSPGPVGNKELQEQKVLKRGQ